MVMQDRALKRHIEQRDRSTATKASRSVVLSSITHDLGLEHAQLVRLLMRIEKGEVDDPRKAARALLIDIECAGYTK